MARLINKLGITVVVDDEQAKKLQSLGYKLADEPKPATRKRTTKKEQ